LVDIFTLIDLFVKIFPWMILNNLFSTVLIDAAARVIAALVFDVLFPLMALFNSVL
jgi:hypothetical protein